MSKSPCLAIEMFRKNRNHALLCFALLVVFKRVAGGRRPRSGRRQLLSVFIAAFITLQPILFSPPRVAAQVTPTLGTPYTQNFDTLPASGSATWTNNSTIPGWFHARTGTGTTIVANNGSSNAGNLYSYGCTDALAPCNVSPNATTDRALGSLGSGNAAIGNLFWGLRIQNNTGSTITQLAISYTGEQWRNSAAAAQTISFSYLVGSPTVTGSLAEFQSAGVAVPQLDFTSPITGGTAGALNGNLAANRVTITHSITGLSIPNGTEIMLRWSDPDHTGADHGLSIDDFSVTANPVIPTNPSGIGDAFPDPIPVGLQTLLTVNVTPGTNPTSTGIMVSGDLTSIGGSATQQFLDDGLNGDATAGDNIFSYNATVGGTPGLKSLPITITDAQARVGNTSISLTVQAAPVALFIHDIQGTVETPQQIGNSVTITGIVIGDYQGSSNLNGFFVQEEDSDVDADPVTSEGIFIFQGSGSPQTAVSLGDRVTVTGTVSNFPSNTDGVTELTAQAITVNNSGNPFPTAATLVLPFATTAADAFERYEGMRVQFSQTLFVTDNSSLGAFGEVTVSANSPLEIPTNSIDPNDNPASGTSITGNSNVPAVTAQQSLNDRNEIVIDDGTSKTSGSLTNPLNPIPFLIGTGTNATLRRGDSVVSLAGVLHYAFGTYRVEPAPTITFTQTNPRPPAPPLVAGTNLRVAAFNVENYFVNFPGPGARGASNATEFTRQRDKLIKALEGLDADVIGLIELQKSGGNAAAADLAAGLTALGTVGTYAAVADLPTLVGTDADIKNGMIYRTSTVSPVGGPLTDLVAPAGTYSRDPLTQIFGLAASGRAFAVSVHHARSKSCAGGSGLDLDQGDGQSCFNDRRRNQSQALVTFLNSLSTTVADILAVGDFNAYGEEDPADVFRAAGYSDAIDSYVQAASQYSFTFNGEAGQLDHAFANSNLAGRVLGASIWHINADEPEIIDYNTESKPDDRYAASPYRSADHDPLVVSINLVSPTAADGTVQGRLADQNGMPIAGAVVRLSGTQNRKSITDANGNYRFDSVETTGFYTVTPSRTNYSFSPSHRSFSQLGNNTEAAFTGSPGGDNMNPLDTPEYFVRQQYVDILGREPDEGGFNYWSDEILRCGSDVGCANARRSDIAAAFFVEKEFQDTGSFIYDMYKAALGRKPAFAEYANDRRQIVGGPNVETQKAAFADSFVQRPAFVQRYQANSTAESFVDALLATVSQSSGVDLANQRDALIIRYQGGASINQSRSLVMRELADNAALRQAEYNAAFVLTEYFSYLRRDPEQGGYDFWLNVLNNGGAGNYRGMVCSFITSTEYQKRFSSVVTHSNAECGAR